MSNALELALYTGTANCLEVSEALRLVAEHVEKINSESFEALCLLKLLDQYTPTGPIQDHRRKVYKVLTDINILSRSVGLELPYLTKIS